MQATFLAQILILWIQKMNALLTCTTIQWYYYFRRPTHSRLRLHRYSSVVTVLSVCCINASCRHICQIWIIRITSSDNSMTFKPSVLLHWLLNSPRGLYLTTTPYQHLAIYASFACFRLKYYVPRWASARCMANYQCLQRCKNDYRGCETAASIHGFSSNFFRQFSPPC